MSADSYKELARHLGHAVEVSSYGDLENVAIECLDCFEILLDYDKGAENE